MIHISEPKIRVEGNYAILESYITVDSKKELVWFKVEKQFEKYLCYERGDAFVIAVLNYAMRNNHDIQSEAPITEELLYNIDKYLIDALTHYNNQFYRTNIIANVASTPLPSAGAVATGISCGVDSLYALACETESKFTKHNITHLTFNNVGSHGEDEEANLLYNSRLAHPKSFAEEFGFTFVASDSNIMNVIRQSHFKTHTYSSMFAVYCLQKLYSVYYYASGGYKYHEFSLEDKKMICSGSYEMFSLPLLSTSQLRIYSQGEGCSRLEKIKKITNYPPSFKHLNVCLSAEKNCGICEKCIRTLLGIDILGAIDKYSEVFDITYYKKNKRWYLQQLVYRTKKGAHDYLEMLPYYNDQITCLIRIRAYIQLFAERVPKKIKETSVGKLIKRLIK